MSTSTGADSTDTGNNGNGTVTGSTGISIDGTDQSLFATFTTFCDY